jgi:predicted site-specific integrase-resolvase
MSHPEMRTSGPVPRCAFRLNEFCAAYGVGRTTVYSEIAAGRLKTYSVGRARFVSAEAAAAWQRDREQDAVAA